MCKINLPLLLTRYKIVALPDNDVSHVCCHCLSSIDVRNKSTNRFKAPPKIRFFATLSSGVCLLISTLLTLQLGYMLYEPQYGSQK
jgi:hypothetical protein